MRNQPTAPVLPGETLAGKYKVERILGSGGMGIVVAARHLELEERVAIKFLLRSTDDAAVLERFLREARAAAKTKSEHVCRVFDVGRLETGEPYLVMEYLEGIDLRERLDNKGALPVDEVASLMIEACVGLSEAHAIGIVHRDLKPANIFLTTRANGGPPYVKLLDFGISKLPSSDAMTSTTALIGSPAYMSPEQIVSARTVDGRADIWSLGIMMHELLSGALPFNADSVLQLSVKIREEDPPSLPKELANPAFEAVIRKCLAKKAADRFADVAELARALAPFAKPESRGLVDRLAPPSAALAATAVASSSPALGTASDNTKPSVIPPKKPSADRDEGESREVVGQVTLEPLSSVAASPSVAAAKSRPWVPVLIVGALAIVATGVVMMKSQAPLREDVTTSVTAPPMSAPPPPASSPSSSMEMATASSASAAPPSPTPSVAAAVVPTTTHVVQPKSSASSASPPPSSSAPVPEVSGKKRRDLDRTDPYPPH